MTWHRFRRAPRSQGFSPRGVWKTAKLCRFNESGVGVDEVLDADEACWVEDIGYARTFCQIGIGGGDVAGEPTGGAEGGVYTAGNGPLKVSGMRTARYIVLLLASIASTVVVFFVMCWTQVPSMPKANVQKKPARPKRTM